MQNSLFKPGDLLEIKRSGMYREGSIVRFWKYPYRNEKGQPTRVIAETIAKHDVIMFVVTSILPTGDTRDSTGNVVLLSVDTGTLLEVSLSYILTHFRKAEWIN